MEGSKPDSVGGAFLVAAGAGSVGARIGSSLWTTGSAGGVARSLDMERDCDVISPWLAVGARLGFSGKLWLLAVSGKGWLVRAFGKA
jgi:hypothetical protein